jgi:hypothetical protein
MIKGQERIYIIVKEYATGIAASMGIKLTSTSVTDGLRLGCLDAHLLKLAHDVQVVSALVYQTDLDKLQNGFQSDRLETTIRTALSRLRVIPAKKI